MGYASTLTCNSFVKASDTPFFFFFFSLTSNLLKRDQLLTTHRSPSTVNLTCNSLVKASGAPFRTESGASEPASTSSPADPASRTSQQAAWNRNCILRICLYRKVGR